LIQNLKLFQQPFSLDDLKAIMTASTTKPYQVNNTQLFAYLFDRLHSENIISKNWQSIIAQNESIKGTRGKLIKANTLSASSQAFDIRKNRGVVKQINEFVTDIGSLFS